jgi:hypothetical protein
MVETFHPSKVIQTVGIECKAHFDVLIQIISIVLLNPVTKSDTVHPPILKTLVWRTPSYIQYNIRDYQRGKEVVVGLIIYHS